MRNLRTNLFCAGLLVMVPSILSAQGTISGAVTDPSGAVVAGVKVEATSPRSSRNPAW
jgi:hypothetical protein